jgi:NitT/TauT family transport system substrate-binding protein
MKLKTLVLSLFLPLSLTIFTGCTNNAPAEAPPVDITSEPLENHTLSIGLMTAVDAAPILVAQHLGFFEEVGLDVELEIFTNAMDRQVALQSGAIDGSITDIIALVNNVSNDFPIKAVSSTNSSFFVVSRYDFDETATDIRAGLMEVSIVNYLTDHFLDEQYNIEKIFINDIQARAEMLRNGQIDVAVLPDPVASNVTLDGELIKLDYMVEDGYSPGVLVFTQDAIDNNTEAIFLFFEAYNKAVDYINEDNYMALDVLVYVLGINPAAAQTMTLPIYTHAQLPSHELVDSVIDWTVSELGQDVTISFDDMFEAKFIR